MSLSNTHSQTFTATNAKYLGSKVAADLKRMQRFYSFPTDGMIAIFEAELVEFLKRGYLGSVTYGFKKGNDWIEPTLKYTAKDLSGLSGTDDDPGRIKPGADISAASFYSYMIYSVSYNLATVEEQESFKQTLPISRSGAEEPGVRGFLSSDKSYTSGGKGLDRSSVKNI